MLNRSRHPAGTTARELFLAGSPHIDTRAHELLATSRLIGHSFAFWFCADYYATKRRGHVRIFRTFCSSSKPSDSRMIAESPVGAGDIVAAIRADALRESAHA